MNEEVKGIDDVPVISDEEARIIYPQAMIPSDLKRARDDHSMLRGPYADLSFSVALTMVKTGSKIARTGWNGKGLYVAAQFPDANSMNSLPYLYIKYPADHKTYPSARCPWLASQTDIMSDDWFVVFE